MTSYEFEVAAKNAVIKTWDAAFDETIRIDELELVWFAHLLGYKKCFVWGKPMGTIYAEITYNRDKNEIYVDLYKKMLNVCIPGTDIDTKVGAKSEL